MEFSNSLLSLLLFLLYVSPLSALVLAHTNNHEDFLKCLSHRINDNTIVSKIIHTSKDSSFFSILDSSIQNPRFSVPETPKPVSIVTPVRASDVQTVIRCALLHGIHVRTRSAGHGWEGQSYIAYNKPYVVIDLRNLRSISLDVENRTGWVQTGATTGELYFEIGKTTKSLAFPASIHPTVGVGGQFSGGGYGTLLRKYGLAADNIIDALVVDARGRILDRQAMGEDYFWAIRGGGGSSFGVVLSWKIKLVDVPSTVTVFKVQKTSEKEAVRIINKWQYVADKVPEDLFISATLERSNENSVQALFTGLYLGPVNNLLALMEEKFPELGLDIQDCTEMSWVESALWFADFSKGESLGVLANRSKEQVLSKIRKLKRRFHVHWEKISEGNDPKFTRSSDSEAFGFSSMIWGQGEFGNDDGMDKEMVKEHEVNGNGAAENGTARIAQENESVEEMLKEHEEMLNENGAEEIRDNNGTARKAQQLESESEEEMLKEHEEPFHVNGAENIRDNNGTTQIAQQSEIEEEMLKEHEEVANTELLNENGAAKTTETGTTGGKERHDDDDDDELCAVQDAFEAIMSQGLSGYQKKLQLEKLMNLGTGKRRELSDEWKALCVEERRLNIKKLRFSAKLAEAANDS